MADPGYTAYLGSGTGSVSGQTLGTSIYDQMLTKAFTNFSVLRSLQDSLFHVKNMRGRAVEVLRQLGRTGAADWAQPGPLRAGEGFAIGKINTIPEDMVVKDHMIPENQILMTDFPIAAELTDEIGTRLAEHYDTYGFISMCLAARGVQRKASDNLSITDEGGYVLNKAASATVAAAYPNNSTGGAALWNDVNTLKSQAAQRGAPIGNGSMPGKVVPFLFVHEYLANEVIPNYNQLYSRDFSNNTAGDLNQGTLGPIWNGCRLVTTSRMPSSVIDFTTGGTFRPTKYDGDFTSALAGGLPAALMVIPKIGKKAAVAMGEWLVPTITDMQESRGLVNYLQGKMMVSFDQYHREMAYLIQCQDVV